MRSGCFSNSSEKNEIAAIVPALLCGGEGRPTEASLETTLPSPVPAGLEAYFDVDKERELDGQLLAEQDSQDRCQGQRRHAEEPATRECLSSR